MSLTLKFCGATRVVTGSCTLVRAPGCSFLVDCGLFQGQKTLKELNYRPFPFEPGNIDFVLLTHGHIDHSGLLPRLWKSGFNGPVYMTEGTRDLLSYMLPDSGHIQEMEVEFLNRRNASRGKMQVSPIYTQRDAEQCQENFRTIAYAAWADVGNGVRTRFWNAGHLLGSASIEVEITGAQKDSATTRVLFSGDIGPEHKLFQPDAAAPNEFDYVVCEATYGGRARTRATPAERRVTLKDIANEALRGEGILLMPLFAVERTQEIIADLTRLQQEHAIPKVPIFLDSPLAIRITKVFQQHAAELEELQDRPSLLNDNNIRFSETAEDSKAIDRIKSGAIVLAASGMCEAGRIRHHLKRWLWSPKATVLLAGYQANGTLGRLLADGVKTVKIQGEEISVKATIRQTDLYSGHADHQELVKWLCQRQPIHKALFLTHGEEHEIDALRSDIIKLGMAQERVVAPVLDDEFDLSGPALRSLPRKGQPPRLEPEQVGRPDWHNEFAQLSIDLREAFERAADERSRNILLRRIRRALEAD
jgi:metallo-beta-lactamase family protein